MKSLGICALKRNYLRYRPSNRLLMRQQIVECLSAAPGELLRRVKVGHPFARLSLRKKDRAFAWVTPCSESPNNLAQILRVSVVRDDENLRELPAGMRG